MSKMVMLDTNVVLAIQHNQTKASQRLSGFQDYTFLISSLVAVEVLVGAHLSRKADTKKLLAAFNVMPFDGAAVQESIRRLAAKYFVDRSSKPYDLLIAAHALTLKVPLITNNIKDYSFGRLKLFHFEEGKWL